MKILRTRKALNQWRANIKDVAFVPTMGALHEGHLSLVKEARKHHRHVIVSIFVNPTQFGPNEDFQRYPRPIKKDLALLKAAKVAAVFLPTVDVIYGGPSQTRVIPDPFLDSILEGPRRPNHFSGVATVVTKLFNLVNPTSAYFGEKDFQQVRVIESLASDLFLPVKIFRVPTLREPTGLAMSSRNQYLSEADRFYAAHFYRVLHSAKSPMRAKQELTGLGFQVEYIEDWEPNLQRPSKARDRVIRRLAAVKFQGVRLIDNVLLRRKVAKR